MKKWLITGGLVFIMVVIAYCMYSDYLPPRTPLKIARVKSGLSIPKTVQVLDFEENYTFTGEGYVLISIKLNQDERKPIIRECVDGMYKKLTIDNLVKDGFLDPNPEFGMNLPKKDICSITEGYYKLNIRDLQQMDFDITVLDINKGELVVYVSFP